jgi:hypothetical protein
MAFLVTDLMASSVTVRLQPAAVARQRARREGEKEISV